MGHLKSMPVKSSSKVIQRRSILRMQQAMTAEQNPTMENVPISSENDEASRTIPPKIKVNAFIQT